MKRVKRNTVFSPVPSVARKCILESVVTSFRIEGIFIPAPRIEAIYARVNEKLKKQIR